MSQDRRAYPRRSIRWNARIEAMGAAKQDVVIRDFCAGGLYLAFPGESTPPDWLGRDGLIELRFADPKSKRERHFAARIVRTLHSGIGVAFPRPMPEVVTTLEALAEAPAAAEPTKPEARVSRLAVEMLGLLRRESETFAESALTDFGTRVVDDLFERARSTGSGSDQNSYYAAFRRLRNQRRTMAGAFVPLLLERIDQMQQPGTAATPPPQPQRAAELSLVDERDFEDWLSRSELVTRMQKRHASQLKALSRRLSYVTGRRIHEENAPIGPTVLCELLTQIVPVNEFDERPARRVYTLFGDTVLQVAGPLYQRLNEALRERQILPDIESERWETHNPSLPSRPSAYDAADESQGDDTAATGAHRSGPDTPTGSAVRAETSQSFSPAVSAGDGGAAAAAPSATTENAPGSEPRRQSAAERVLAGYRHTHRPNGGAVASDPRAPRISHDDSAVLDAVERARAQSMASPSGGADDPPPQGLAQQVMAGLGVNDLGALTSETQEAVEILDDWFGDIENNALQSGLLRDWSGRMALLALKVQLERGEFLQVEAKPIHELLDHLDRAGAALATVRSGERQRLRGELDRILATALDERSGHTDAVADANRQIAELITQPLRSRAANMQRVLQQCEGSQKLERARQVVNRELDRRFARRPIPKLLHDFIEQGWRGVLILVWLRSGSESDGWRRGLEVVDRLLEGLGSGDSRARPIARAEEILAYAGNQLTTYARMTSELEEILGQLREHLLQVCRDGRASRRLPLVEPPASAADDAARERIAPRWLGQVKLLKRGDWLFFAGKGDDPEALRLQWISEDKQRFVFVDRAGFKARDLSQVELAELLAATSAGLSEDFDAPLTERQWQKRLQQMHDEMLRHATHDPLTGLLNRKKFLRELERPPASGVVTQCWHALIYCSIDGFSVVNSTQGQEAGDLLLGRVGQRLSLAVGERGVVGRMGGDEFAVLLHDVRTSEAEAFAERQRKAINQERFAHGTQSLTIAVSVGVVGFRHGSHVAETLLRDADEACRAAKLAGGNRIHVVTPDDRELLQLRGSMERAARVDAALESGALVLRCQRVQPINEHAGLEAFYEVLTSIKAGDGTEIPPDEFIPAAERFGRMAAVDRQVIRGVMDWCAAHPQAMAEIGGFFINLSGPTLNDAGLPAYLREQLALTGVDGKRICFEITETAAVQNLAQAADLIAEIKELGCSFSLDDFGTGLSSYAYLKNLPIDYLKIDGQFVRNIDQDAADHAMVRSINELGHFLGKRTVGEYVETDAALAQLREIGVDYAQGYGVSRPIALTQLLGA